MRYEEIFINAKKCKEKTCIPNITYKKSHKLRVVKETVFYSFVAFLFVLNVVFILNLFDVNFSSLIINIFE
jgi:hypothetical protein